MDSRSAWATFQDLPLPCLNLKVYFMWMCVCLCEFNLCALCVCKSVWRPEEGVVFFGTVL